jgi:hypothetical protein
MKKIIMLSFLLLVFGCKEKLTEVPIKKEIIKEDPILKLDLLLTSESNDAIRCFFGKIELDNTNQEGSYYIENNLVKGMESNISFKMFGDYIPNIVQLRLGKKPLKIIFEKVRITYGEKEIIVNGEDLDRYFAINKYLTFNKDEKSIMTKQIDGRLSPNLTLKRGFINKLFDLN